MLPILLRALRQRFGEGPVKDEPVSLCVRCMINAASHAKREPSNKLFLIAGGSVGPWRATTKPGLVSRAKTLRRCASKCLVCAEFSEVTAKRRHGFQVQHLSLSGCFQDQQLQRRGSLAVLDRARWFCVDSV